MGLCDEYTCISSIRLHTSAYVCIRQHTHASAYAYASIRQHTLGYAYVSIRQRRVYRLAVGRGVAVFVRQLPRPRRYRHFDHLQRTSAYVSICQHMSAYVSIRGVIGTSITYIYNRYKHTHIHAHIWGYLCMCVCVCVCVCVWVCVCVCVCVCAYGVIGTWITGGSPDTGE
jgi:hypothetical protein